MQVQIDWMKVEWLMQKRGIDDVDHLAELVGVHRLSLVRISQGKSLPSMQNLGRLCMHLGAQPGDILSYVISEEDENTKFYLFSGEIPVDEKKWDTFVESAGKWLRHGRFGIGDKEDLSADRRLHLQAMIAFEELGIDAGEYKRVVNSEKWKSLTDAYEQEQMGIPLSQQKGNPIFAPTGADYDRGQEFHHRKVWIDLFIMPMHDRESKLENWLASLENEIALEESQRGGAISESATVGDVDESGTLPTVKIDDGKGGYIVINESDFNPTEHLLWTDPTTN